MDYPEKAPDSMLALEGAAQGALKEACATLEDITPTKGSHIVDQVVWGAPSEVATDPSFLTRLAMAGPRRAKMLDRIVLSSFVQPMEWNRLSVDTLTPGLEAA